MNNVAVLCLVLIAAYGLMSLLLSVVVAFTWTAWLAAKPLMSRSLFALRMLPSLGALFLTLSVVLPAFLIKEPNRAAEPVGPLLILMVAYVLVTLGAGCMRGWRAWLATTKLLRDCGTRYTRFSIAGRDVEIIDIPGIMVAALGAWRPRIVAAACVLEACSREEFREVIGHEAAHILTHDNLKLLLLLSSADILAAMPAGKALIARWRAAAEFEADAMATAQDPLRRVTLASALIKVARLSGARRPLAELSMPILVDDVDGRVRRLLAPLPTAHSYLPAKNTAALALLLPFLSVPIYGLIQDWIEMLVAFGR
jgi:Zn-dependent protease with chaperone function